MREDLPFVVLGVAVVGAIVLAVFMVLNLYDLWLIRQARKESGRGDAAKH